MLKKLSFLILCSLLPVSMAEAVSLGPRPFILVEQLDAGPLKEKLQICAQKILDGEPVRNTLFSIGHRGAPLQFAEHTRESYLAAAHMGAGILECDVTFTRDRELVCRHSQKDLATTTNILATDLAKTCIVPFRPSTKNTKAKAECRTSEITLSEFKNLEGKMDAANQEAKTVDGFMDGTARFRTDIYADAGATLLSHKESIALFKSLAVKFTPELKAPAVAMPFDGMSQTDYAQKLVDEYIEADIPPSDVYLQSFNLQDILYWIERAPDFGKQAVFLDGRARDGLDPMKPGTFSPTMKELKAMGINYIAPPLWMLLTVKDGSIASSAYAEEANKAGLKLITWTLERSGSLKEGGGWYYQTVKPLIKKDSDMLKVLHILAQDAGVVGVFSDWPAITSFYAHCMGLE